MITITPLGRYAGGQAHSSSSSFTPALCYLIRIDAAYILLDCGSPEDFNFGPAPQESVTLENLLKEDGQLDTETLSKLPLDTAIEAIAPRVQLVLLSHSSIRHVGLYAYAKARLGLTCTAYSTLPTASMGRLVSLEAAVTIAADCDVSKIDKRPLRTAATSKITNQQAVEHFAGKGPSSKTAKGEMSGVIDGTSETQRDRCVPTRAEIDDAFENIRTLRYLQPTILDGTLSSLSLTAHSAGHTLGGTVWKLRSPTSGTVVLAIDWNHVRERHIDGSGVIEGAAIAAQGAGSSGSGGRESRAGEEAAGTKRAEVLVTSGQRLDKVNARRKDKDKKLLDLVHHTLTVSKSTLHMPMDASPRLLEVLLLLDQHWAYAYPHARFPLCLVSRMGKEAIERARTMREWMGRQLQGEEAANLGKSGRQGQPDNGSLEFKFLRIFTSLSALSAAIPPESAKVVITTGTSLLYGPSLKFFRDRVAGDRASTILLTQQAQEGSLASTLRTWWEQGQGKGWSERLVGNEVEGSGRRVDGLCIQDKVPLQGSELEEHMEKERVRKEKEEHYRAMLARSRKRLEADEDDEEDEGEDESSDEESDDGLISSTAGLASEGGSKKRKRGDARLLADGEGGGTAASGSKQAEDGVESTDLISHDVYLRGAAARATNYFGSGKQHRSHRSGPNGQVTAAQREREARERHGVGNRFRTFPIIEKRKRVDAYGEAIDVARWLSRGRKDREMEEEENKKLQSSLKTGIASSDDAKKRKLDEFTDEDDDELAGVPSKFVSESVSLSIHCQIMSIDLEGLIDGRALSIVLPQLAPRRLVLVNAPQPLPADTKFEVSHQTDVGQQITPTRRFIESLLSIRDFTREIYAPTLGQCVSVGAEVRSFDVRLGEGVLESIEMGSYEEWSLGWVKGQVSKAIASSDDGALAEDSADNNSSTSAGPGWKAPATFVTLDRSAHHNKDDDEDDEEEDARDDALVAEAAAAVGGQYRHPDRIVYHASSGKITRGSDTRTSKSRSGDTKQHHPVTLFIGDVRLSKLKTALSSSAYRIPAEFGGSGVLVCGSAALSSALGAASAVGGAPPSSASQASAAVTVQKVGEEIVIEGNAGRTFVRIRDAVYAMHARVSQV